MPHNVRDVAPAALRHGYDACAKGCNACVARVTRQGHPGSTVSRRMPAQKETFMTHGRRITIAALTALAISACSKNNEPTVPAVPAAPDTTATNSAPETPHPTA